MSYKCLLVNLVRPIFETGREIDYLDPPLPRKKYSSRSKIGQTTQKMIHFVPNMYVSGKISAPRSRTQDVKSFRTPKKTKKARFQDLQVCVFFWQGVMFFSLVA